MDELHKDMEKLAKNIAHAIDNTIPRSIAKEGQDYFEESFVNQSFDGVPWEEVERRKPESEWYGFEYGAKSKRPGRQRRSPKSTTNFSPAATRRKVLTGASGELGDSIRNTIKKGTIVFHTEKEYAQVHNEGGNINIFGKKLTKIARRQFMGYSREFDRQVDKIVEKRMKQAFNSI